MSLVSILHATPGCDVARLTSMMRSVVDYSNCQGNCSNFGDALRIDSHCTFTSSYIIRRFIVSAIVGLVEQNTPYPTDRPEPIQMGWPLVELCGVFSDHKNGGGEPSELDYRQRIMPWVAGLYYNGTGLTTGGYCVDHLGRPRSSNHSVVSNEDTIGFSLHEV
jgi:hypothetical protein